MGVISLMLKGEELGKEHIFPLRRGYKLKYLKLLHFYTNIDSLHFKTSGIGAKTNEAERLLFARFNFINSDMYDNFEEGHSYVSMGSTNHKEDKIITRDLYKVLLDKPVIHLEGDIRIRFFYLDSQANLQSLKTTDIIDQTTKDAKSKTFANIIFEYEEIQERY